MERSTRGTDVVKSLHSLDGEEAVPFEEAVRRRVDLERAQCQPAGPLLLGQGHEPVTQPFPSPRGVEEELLHLLAVEHHDPHDAVFGDRHPGFVLRHEHVAEPCAHLVVVDALHGGERGFVGAQPHLGCAERVGVGGTAQNDGVTGHEVPHLLPGAAELMDDPARHPPGIGVESGTAVDQQRVGGAVHESLGVRLLVRHPDPGAVGGRWRGRLIVGGGSAPGAGHPLVLTARSG